MSNEPIRLPSRQAASQAAVVEQSRAVAEVQAAVVVAQQVPRDTRRAEAEMEDACKRKALAERAFYSVPNRGRGPSVHLARELARIWGNVQYGVHELSRDDAAGESEIIAFAWDVQANTRSSRTFIVPHQRMVQKKRTDLTDLGDVYLNNQNIGARAVRECIFTVLPDWYVEAAKDICARTIKEGDGKPLSERLTAMVGTFKAIHVTERQIADRLGKKRGQWDAGDLAAMTVVYQSISRGETTIGDEFPTTGVSAAELIGETVNTATGEVTQPAFENRNPDVDPWTEQQP